MRLAVAGGGLAEHRSLDGALAGGSGPGNAELDVDHRAGVLDADRGVDTVAVGALAGQRDRPDRQAADGERPVASAARDGLQLAEQDTGGGDRAAVDREAGVRPGQVAADRAAPEQGDVHAGDAVLGPDDRADLLSRGGLEERVRSGGHLRAQGEAGQDLVVPVGLLDEVEEECAGGVGRGGGDQIEHDVVAGGRELAARPHQLDGRADDAFAGAAEHTSGDEPAVVAGLGLDRRLGHRRVEALTLFVDQRCGVEQVGELDQRLQVVAEQGGQGRGVADVHNPSRGLHPGTLGGDVVDGGVRRPVELGAVERRAHRVARGVFGRGRVRRAVEEVADAVAVAVGPRDVAEPVARSGRAHLEVPSVPGPTIPTILGRSSQSPDHRGQKCRPWTRRAETWGNRRAAYDRIEEFAVGTKAQALYEAEIRKLPPDERLRLVELITRDLADAELGTRPRRSILELRGLGAEIWRGIDAQDYVSELRDEWDHRP